MLNRKVLELAAAQSQTLIVLSAEPDTIVFPSVAAKVPCDHAFEDAVQQLRHEHRLTSAAAAHEPEELRGVGGVEPHDNLGERPLACAWEVRHQLLVPQVAEVVRLEAQHGFEVQLPVRTQLGKASSELFGAATGLHGQENVRGVVEYMGSS